MSYIQPDHKIKLKTILARGNTIYCSEIQRDTTRYNEIQRDTTRYNEIQRDTTTYNEIQRHTTRYNDIQRVTFYCLKGTTRYNESLFIV